MFRILLVAVTSLVTASSSQADDSTFIGGFSDDVISLADDSPAANEVRNHLAETLAELHPQANIPPLTKPLKSGCHAICGDLFKTGTFFALIDSPSRSSRVALAEWTDEKWQLRGLWKMPVVWLPKGERWDGEENSTYFPVEPFHEPFELRDLSGDGVPEVLVSGEVDKYFRSTYLLKFEPQTRGLDLVAWTMNKPERAGDFVKLYSNSGRRSIWEEWSFHQWEGGKLVEKASWHSEVPYNNVDPEFIVAGVSNAAGKSDRYRITHAESENEDEDAFTITRNDQPFASVTVDWRHKGDQDRPPDFDEVEHAWLFEKITGLPRVLLPDRRDAKIPGKLEEFATFKVSGSEEGRKMFSAAK